MKKNLFLILALILISCSPQVTVTPEATPTTTIPPPTETPIPTPTLNPYFVAVQNFISDLNENLTLLPDGSIENNGVPIPNLHVDQNGVINIIFNNEHVVIEASQISFDTENGLTIEGYELNENGEWVALTPADVATDILSQYGVDIESVTITEADGIASVVDNEKGNVLFETDGEQSKFSLSFAVDTIAAKSCEPTNFAPNHNGLVPGGADYPDEWRKYRDKLINDSGIPRWTGRSTQYFLVDRESQCWGRFEATNQEDEQKDKVMIYRDADGVVQVIPLLDVITWDAIYAFAGDR